MSSNQFGKFGPRNGIDSKDYILYMQGNKGVTDKPVQLLGHGLSSPNVNLTEPVSFSEVVISQGRVITISRVKRAAYETGRTYTINMPSALWTPAMEAALKNGCVTTFYLRYTCPERIYNHFEVIPEGVMSPPVPAEDLITTSDDTNMISFTSELTAPKQLRGWAIGYENIYDAGSASIQAIAFRTADCVDCAEAGAMSLVAVGGDGVAAPSVWLTKDRFSTVTTPTLPGATAGDVAKAVYTKNDTILVATYTGTSFSAATQGNMYLSVDGGDSFTQLALTDVIADIFEAAGMIFAVGKDSSSQAVIWVSDNMGRNWSQISSAALPASTSLMSGSYDEVTGKIYFVGGTKLLVGRIVGATLTLTDISANLPTVTSLQRVLVIGKNELLVGGTSGYLVQSRDGGLTFEKLNVGNGDVRGIAGNQYRLVVTAGNKIFERTVMTDNDLVQVVLEDGQAVLGNYTHLAMAPEHDFNRFAACTTAGEVVFAKPFYPNA